MRAKVGFATFGDGAEAFVNAAHRLEMQAKQCDEFTEVVNFNIYKLSSIDEESANKLLSFRSLSKDNKYLWATKSLILRAFMQGLIFPNCQLLLYADAGCELQLNFFSRQTLAKMIGFALKYGGYAESTGLLEVDWTKPRTLLEIGPQFANTEQVQSTWFIMSRSRKGINFADRWIELSNPTKNLWQDETKPNSAELYPHRHDQSIFSLLWKASNIRVAPKEIDWDETRKIGALRSIGRPILAVRNRSGKTSIPRIPKALFILYPLLYVSNKLAVYFMRNIFLKIKKQERNLTQS